jgi:hypothetical protein
VVEHLPRKHENLNLIPSILQKEGREGGRKRKEKKRREKKGKEKKGRKEQRNDVIWYTSCKDP